MKGVFITGTDTGVGKTLVAGGLLWAVRKMGIQALPFKPVQTGCAAGSGDPEAQDLDFVLRAAEIGTDRIDEKLSCPFRFRHACSPHLAGELEGGSVTVEAVLDKFFLLGDKCDAVIAEGAGGVLVPLNRREVMADLIAALGLPVLVVARAGLGTINHTLMTLETLRGRNIEVAGVVMNHVDEGESYISGDNPGTIANFGGVAILAEVPFIVPPVLPSSIRELSGVFLETAGKLGFQ